MADFLASGAVADTSEIGDDKEQMRFAKLCITVFNSVRQLDTGTMVHTLLRELDKGTLVRQLDTVA